MQLIKTIQDKFVTAMKAKDENTKIALSNLKAKIMVAQKANLNQPLEDTAIMKIIISSVKQMKESIEQFKTGGRLDLVEKETNEMSVLEQFLPKQLRKDEIETLVNIKLEESTETNIQRRNGMIMGALNKEYPGQIDGQILKSIMNSLPI